MGAFKLAKKKEAPRKKRGTYLDVDSKVGQRYLNGTLTMQPLSPEKIEERKKQEWKERDIDIPDDLPEGKKNSLKNLTGPKTEEGRAKALMQLRPPRNVPKEENPELLMIGSLLTVEEKEFYVYRKQQYLKDFELNDSSDWKLLDSVLMEEIYERRVRALMLTGMNRDYDEILNNINKRRNDALKNLGITRADRIKNKDVLGKSIADVVKNFDKKRKTDMQQKQQKYDIEEEEIRKMMLHDIGATSGSDAVASEK